MMKMDLNTYCESSVLCWLATVSHSLVPNVSPKEVFTLWDDERLLIANIASPVSEQNILANPNVCVSMIDVFEQRGYKLSGKARIVRPDDTEWSDYIGALRELADERFPIKNIFEVQIQSSTTIIAPSYFLFSDTTVEEQVKGALSTYQVERPRTFNAAE
ncbi:pyridoxamine 5'-phosphate oxidase family protein [Vibrio fluvialis]|uniref:pyridoxamine 5'-phosphate oxidase family protein n=1 Tax=Vibrio fluvialis TaxID=676 RepID=UPI00238040E6|nr:pyridoxamine 5'-phosphate oxidase family protein [Vibrio fluvialis]WDY54829.1 pyridoxamine 5'-phosphate oxidase family protein [Vibrio fluvialis]